LSHIKGDLEEFLGVGKGVVFCWGDFISTKSKMKRFLDSADYVDGQHSCIGYASVYSLKYQNNLRLVAGFEEHYTKVDEQNKFIM